MTFLLTRMLTDSEETEDFGVCWLIQAQCYSQVWQYVLHVPERTRLSCGRVSGKRATALPLRFVIKLAVGKMLLKLQLSMLGWRVFVQ